MPVMQVRDFQLRSQWRDDKSESEENSATILLNSEINYLGKKEIRIQGNGPCSEAAEALGINCYELLISYTSRNESWK